MRSWIGSLLSSWRWGVHSSGVGFQPMHRRDAECHSDATAHDSLRAGSYNTHMFELMTRKKMTGGLVFGPGAWSPERIESTFAQGPSEAEEEKRFAAGASPGNREGLLRLLDESGIVQTCPQLPGLAEQVRGLSRERPALLILNLLPVQPEYVLGAALSRLAMADMLRAMRILDVILSPGRTLVVMDRHDHQTRRLWKRGMTREKTPLRLGIKRLLNRYPQGHPSILLRTVAGLRLGVGASPAQVGSVIVDPVGAWALGGALATGQRFTQRPVQFFEQESAAGGGAGGPRMLMGRIGETFAEFWRRHRIAVADGAADGRAMQVIVNGMLAGEEVDAREAVITGTVEAISVRPRMDKEAAFPCISCGWCVDVCPTALTPVHLLELSLRGHGRGAVAEAGRGERREAVIPCPSFLPPARSAREARHCIACGLCSYVCPTRLPLMRQIVSLRARTGGAAGGTAEGARG